MAVNVNRNEARALRVLEIANDFRTLQHHINSLVTRPAAQSPDAASGALPGYVLLTQARGEARRILALNFNQEQLGFQPGQVPATAQQMQQLQRIILDISARRFQAHRTYLRASAATRWVSSRAQILQGQQPNARHVEALRAVDLRLRQEIAEITDQHVMRQLREADVRKKYWVDEDPSLEQILAQIRRQG